MQTTCDTNEESNSTADSNGKKLLYNSTALDVIYF